MPQHVGPHSQESAGAYLQLMQDAVLADGLLCTGDLRLQDDVKQQRQVGHARPLPPRQLSLHGLLLHGAHSLTQALLIPACQQRCSPALHSEPVELPEVQLWSQLQQKYIMQCVCSRIRAACGTGWWHCQLHQSMHVMPG